MSQTETHFGKLRIVVIDEGDTIEDWCREKCEEEGMNELDSYYDNWLKQFRSEVIQKKYFIVGDEIWEVIEHIKNDGFDDIDVMIPNEDGTITFVQQFYNGGTYLGEVIEEGIENLKNKQK
jgi:hypothetical protein